MTSMETVKRATPISNRAFVYNSPICYVVLLCTVLCCAGISDTVLLCTGSWIQQI